jgi:nitrogen fixation protein NifU and related proteins
MSQQMVPGFQATSEPLSDFLTEEEEIYKENIIDHYKQPRNKRELAKFTTKQQGFNPLCGDDITLFLKIINGKIASASFIGDGCAISQAATSMLTEQVTGITLNQAKTLSQDDVLEILGIPISHTRIKCATLALKALAKSLEGRK